MSDYNPEHESLAERLAALGPECKAMARDLLAADVSFAHEMLDAWDALDEEDKPDRLAFHDSDGPRKCHELRVRHEDGTPTSGDLERWAD